MKTWVTLGLIASAVAANAYTVLDDFSTNQSAVILTSAGSASNTIAVGSLSRLQELFVNLYTDPDNFERAYSRVSGGMWIGSSDAGVTGQWMMNYSGPSSVLSNQSATTVYFNSIDQNAMLHVYWQSGSLLASNTVSVSANNSPQAITVNAVTVDPGFDWNNVTRVVYTIDGPSGLDFKIDKIETVPEPASMIALGIGALALIRRKKSA